MKAPGKSAGNMILKYILKETVPSWYILRTETPSAREVWWLKDTSVAGWTVKKNILGNQAELLQKGSKNT